MLTKMKIFSIIQKYAKPELGLVLLLASFLSFCSDTETNATGGGVSYCGTNRCGASGCAPGTISGKVTYELPQFSAGNGLNLASPTIITKNVRQAVVQIVKCSDGVTILGSGKTDDSGNYSVSYTPGSENEIKVRILARVDANPSNPKYKSDDSTNNILVNILDNTNGNPGGGGCTSAPCNQWSMISAGHDITVNSTITNVNLLAEVSTNAAAPFSILDIAVNAYNYILVADPTLTFAKLNVYWSTSNTPTGGNKPIGYITTSHWGADHAIGGNAKALYILGKTNVDTDEYDLPVVGHEFGHYIEATIFRSDSFGGSHAIGNMLDPRVAFSEGFATAFGAMVNNSNVYYDTGGANNVAIALNLDLENKATSNNGFDNESSVWAVVWDIFDNNNHATQDSNTDTLNLGFSPIYLAMKNRLKVTSSLATLLPFINGLKTDNAGSAALIDTVVAYESIPVIADDFGFTNSAGATGQACRPNAYQSVTLPLNDTGGTIDMNAGGSGNNKICATEYYKFTGDGANYTYTLTPSVNCDMNLYLYKNGSILGWSQSAGEGAAEQFNYTATNGVVYVLLVQAISKSGTTTGVCTYTQTIN